MERIFGPRPLSSKAEKENDVKKNRQNICTQCGRARKRELQKVSYYLCVIVIVIIIIIITSEYPRFAQVQLVSSLFWKFENKNKNKNKTQNDAHPHTFLNYRNYRQHFKQNVLELLT